MSKAKPQAKKQAELFVQVIIDPADASKDRYLAPAHLQRYALRGLVVPDVTNSCWCSVYGRPLPPLSLDRSES
jgi:hypothetical protein